MRRRGEERGTVSIEVVVLVPLLVLVAMLTLQLGVAAWTASQAQEAARQAARAQSLGENPGAAAERALPGSLDLVDLDADGHETVRVTVEIPRVLSFLPLDDVTREATIRSVP